MILIKSGKGDSDTEKEFLRQAANQNMNDTITGYPWIEPIEVFNLSTSSFAVIQMLPYLANEYIEDYTLLKRLYYKIQRITRMKTVFGIGNWVQKISEIKNSYHQASVAIIQNSDNFCRYYKELVEVDIHNLGSSDESRTITAAFIKLDEHTLLNIIDKKIGGSTVIDSLSFVNFIVMYLHIALSIINEYAQVNVERIQEMVMNIFTALTKKAVYRYQDDLKSLTGLVLQIIKLEKTQLNNDLIQRVKKKIIELFASEIRISELARDLGYSPNHLGATFKKETGQTIHDFWHLARIEKAKNLLKKETGLISEIAEQVGYNDQYYFSNVFKRYTDLSPKEFRNS